MEPTASRHQGRRETKAPAAWPLAGLAGNAQCGWMLTGLPKRGSLSHRPRRLSSIVGYKHMCFILYNMQQSRMNHHLQCSNFILFYSNPSASTLPHVSLPQHMLIRFYVYLAMNRQQTNIDFSLPLRAFCFGWIYQWKPAPQARSKRARETVSHAREQRCGHNPGRPIWSLASSITSHHPFHHHNILAMGVAEPRHFSLSKLLHEQDTPVSCVQTGPPPQQPELLTD